MISLLLSIIPIIVSAGVIGMIACDDIIIRALIAIPVLGLLAWQRIRTE